MKARVAQFFLGVVTLVLPLLVSGSLQAQVANPALRGTVTNPSGAPVANAKISVKNVDTAETTTAQTDPAGVYNLPNLAPGDYQVSVSADGFGTEVVKVTLKVGVTQNTDVTLITQPATAPPQNPAETLPNAPSSSRTEPSLL